MQNTTDLTPAQASALNYLRQEGWLCSGTNVTRAGYIVRVQASTLRALAARGLATVDHATDGGIHAKPTVRAWNPPTEGEPLSADLPS